MKLVFKRGSNDFINQEYIDNLNNDRYMEFMDFAGSRWDQEKLEDYILKSNKDEIENLYFVFDGEEIIGTFRLTNHRESHRTIDIGIMVFERFAGLGYGSKILSEVNRYVLEKTNVRRINAGIYTDNLGSLKAFLNVGYVVEGLQRDYGVINGKSLDRYLVVKELGER